MKKLIAVIALTLGIAAAAVAQPRTAGIRLGYGLDLTYQHSFGEKNMITADLSLPWTFNGAGITGTYDWINPFNATIPWSYYGNWNWYLGAGANINMGGNSSKIENIGATTIDRTFYFGFGAAGRVGVEYELEIPLTFAVEYTPVVGPAFGHSSHSLNVPGQPTVQTIERFAGFGIDGLIHIGLAIRYRF